VDKKYVIIIWIIFVIIGCDLTKINLTEPSTIEEKNIDNMPTPSDVKYGYINLKNPISIDATVGLLDVLARFDFNVTHIAITFSSGVPPRGNGAISTNYYDGFKKEEIYKSINNLKEEIYSSINSHTYLKDEKYSPLKEIEIRKIQQADATVLGYQGYFDIKSLPYIESLPEIDSIEIDDEENGNTYITDEKPITYYVNEGTKDSSSEIDHFWPDAHSIEVVTEPNGEYEGNRRFSWSGIWTSEDSLESLHYGDRPAFEPDIKLKFDSIFPAKIAWAKHDPRQYNLTWYSNFTNAYLDTQASDFLERAYTIGTTEANDCELNTVYYTVLVVPPDTGDERDLDYKFQKQNAHLLGDENDNPWLCGLPLIADWDGEEYVFLMGDEIAPCEIDYQDETFGPVPNPINGWYLTVAHGFQDISISQNGDIWACGANGTIWYSLDSGASWTKTPAAGFRRIASTNSIVVASGNNGPIWWSNNYGVSWTAPAASDMGDVAATIWAATTGSMASMIIQPTDLSGIHPRQAAIVRGQNLRLPDSRRLMHAEITLLAVEQTVRIGTQIYRRIIPGRKRVHRG